MNISNNNNSNNIISKKEIDNLNEKLSKANKIIETQQIKIKELENQLNNKDNKIKLLENEINIKNEELKKLKNISFKKEQYSLDDICIVYFTTTDQRFHLPLKCTKNETFAEVEEKLYKEYPEYRETNNYFISKGKEILRFKTIGDNNIGDGLPVILTVPNNE